MSTLVELLVHHYSEWPKHKGEPFSTIVQSPKGILWLNRPSPNYDPRWVGNDWNSDFIYESHLADIADDYQTAIVTKEMWEEAKFWADAPPDATHRSDEIPDKYRAGFYKRQLDDVWVVWAPTSQKWIISTRCRKESNHSFLIPRTSLPTQAKSPENDVDNW